ncbi:magnesium transporter CorA family protein [Lentzea tibetensis]|uniref:Magnesium transporter CorA family protein n=1 Tax=Lentzea tibetensis TaxID=2591470 RepID=A0A563ETE7_9PSEU|nr:magnesium transporter CorA family protein [Lentzea tibetensis]TWP50946.1 magnesium transporter CorA family protein [Lentzea tibetensis]
MVRSRLYRDGALVESDFPITRLAELVKSPENIIWFDLCAPEKHEIELVRDELGLHELAIEDAFQEHQRPKLDRYPSHLFLTAYAVEYDETMVTTEIDAFITDQVLLTVRQSDSFDVSTLTARWDRASDLVNNGVGFLLHGLLDAVVDGHYATAQQLDDEIEALEDEIFDERPNLGRKALRLRRALAELRKVALPMREVLGSLMTTGNGLVSDELMPYYHDVKDHALFTFELTESMRELVTNLREAQLNVQGNRLNLIMKKVTSWAAIIAVPTAVSGYYGMNVPYPGFEQPWGVWMSTVGIVVLSVYLYAMFKRRDWL